MCCLAGRLTDAANGFGVVCSSILGYVIVSIEATVSYCPKMRPNRDKLRRAPVSQSLRAIFSTKEEEEATRGMYHSIRAWPFF